MTRPGELSDILDICAEVGGNLDLLDRLELTIERLAECDPPKAWAGWLCYILESLQEKTDEHEYTHFLRCLRADITTRLEAGRW